MNRIMKYETLLLKNNQFFCIVKLNISCLYSAWMQRQYNDRMIFFLNSCNTIENSPFLSSLYSLFHLKCFANSRANRCKTLESLHVFFFWGVGNYSGLLLSYFFWAAAHVKYCRRALRALSRMSWSWMKFPSCPVAFDSSHLAETSKAPARVLTSYIMKIAAGMCIKIIKIRDKFFFRERQVCT